MWPIRRRSDAGDHVNVERVGGAYPRIFSLVSGHRDAPLTPRAKALWWLAGSFVVAGGVALIIYAAR